MAKKKKNKNKTKKAKKMNKKKRYSKRKVKRLVKRLFSIFTSAKEKASKEEKMKDKNSQINYKLSQRLDSAGHTELAQKVAEWPDENQGFFSRMFSSFAAKPLGYKLKLLGGGAAGSVLLFGVIAFGLIWYRGTDVILLDELSGEKETPVLALSKQEQTEYGVGTDTKWLALRIDETEEDVKFRALGAQNKIDVSPSFDYSVELTSDGRGLQVVPKSELKPGTNYTVTLRKGTMFTNGASLEKDFVWTFRTEPEFAVTGITPRDGSTSAPVDTTIEVELNYKNYDPKAFEDYFTVTPDVAGKFEQHGKKMVFLPEDNLIPNSRYTVEVKKGFENSEGQALEYDYISNFMTSSQDSDDKYIEYPSLRWTEQSPLVSVTQDAWIGLSAYGINSSTDFTLYSTSIEGLTDIVGDYKWEINRKPNDIEEIDSFSKRPEDVDFFKVDFPDYGIYFLEAYNREYKGSVYKFLIYSPVGVVSSNAHDNSKNWVYDMNEKSPLSGATVYYYNLDESENSIYTDTTNQYGFSEYDKNSVDLVIADYSGNYAVQWVDSPRTQSYSYGYGPYGSYWGNYNEENRAFIFTDKPLYKPGDTVRYKVIVRSEDDMSYEVPGDKEVTVRLGNGFVRWDGTKEVPLYEEKLQVSENFGTAESEFVLPQNVETGYQQLSVLDTEGSFLGSADVEISQYTKPKYDLNVEFDKSYGFSGDTVELSMNGEDYSGNPASGLKVELSVARSEFYNPIWFESKDDIDSAYGGYQRENILRKTFTLNSNGKANYSFDLDVSGIDGAIGFYEVNLYAPDEYMVSDYSKIIVADDPVALFAQPDKRSVGVGEDNSVNFWSTNLWDFEDEGGVRIEATVKREWTEWVESGEYYNPATKATVPLYDSEEHSEVVLENEELVTDDDGLAELNLTDLEKGYYTINTVHYNGDNEISKEFKSVFYVFGPPSDTDAVYDEWSAYSEIFKTYTDQDEYEVGDEAEITVKTTLEGKGLVMFKRGDVYDWKEVDLSSGLVEIQQDITDDMAPEVNICVWGIKEYNSYENSHRNVTKEHLSNIFFNECKKVKVNHDYGELNVEVSSDKEVYGPGEKVRLEVEVTNGQDKGVKSEVTVDVVDKSLLSLVEDEETGPRFGVHRYFYENVKQRAEIRGSMFDYHYASFGGAGGSGGDVSTRDNFLDVANWTATVETDASGRGQAVFKLPDNLTTWVVRSLAVSEDTWVGEGISEFRTNKEVFVDTKPPQFLRSDDKLELDLSIANYSGSNISGNLNVKCGKCVNTESSEEISISNNSRNTVIADIQPKSGVDEVTVLANLDSGGQSLDSVEWSIPVIPSGFVTANTKSILMEQGEEESEIEFTIPEDVNLNGSDLNITVSKSFVNEWALVPVDPSIRSSVELSNSVVHNSIFYKYHDEIKPNEDKEVYKDKIESALNMMKQNQASNGGFGWFDYDAVNYELSSYVGVAYGLAKDAGIETDESVMNNLALYLKQGLESDEISIDEKIYAVYALAVMGEDDILPYAIWLKENSDEYSDSPLNVAHLMLALQWLDDMGDGLSLVPYLEDTANISKRSATWQDPEAPFRLVKSKKYTTSVVYLALSEYGELELSELARNWLVDNNISVYGNDFEAVGLFYALTAANIDNLKNRKDVNKVTIRINGEDYRTVDVGGNENYVGKADLKIPVKYLKSGENKIEVYRDGGGELYVISNLEYFSNELPTGEIEFTVKRKFIDYYTGQEIISAQRGQVVKIRTDVTVDRDAKNLVVRDLMPSSFEPVRFRLGGYESIIDKWWQWDSSEYVNRYGSVGQQQVSFYEYQVADGKTYSFEYPVVAVYGGEFSSGGAQGYIQNFEDIDGYTQEGRIEVN